jgi:cytidine deaminase
LEHSSYQPIALFMDSFSFPFQRSLSTQVPQQIQDLISAAHAAAHKAYAPYSSFKVGAAVLLNDGTVITGANQENASFPAGICAERVVLGQLILDGSQKVKAIAIASGAARDGQQPPLSPCGTCRQTLLEIQLQQQQPIIIYMTNPAGEVIIVEDASYLLPFHFSNEQL